MFKKSLIGIVLFGVVAIFLLQIDDDLNPEVTAFLELAEPAEHSEAYLYLLGIVAAEGEDPLTVGKQVFSSMRQAEEHYSLGDDTFEIEEYPEERKLPLPNGSFFCSNCSADDQGIVYPNKDESVFLLKTHATLLRRYQAFIMMKDYHVLSKPSIVETIPPYRPVIIGNKLAILNAINTARVGETELAISMLANNISALRYYLNGADTFIGKMVFTAMVAENLDALSILFQQHKGIAHDEIAPISVTELSFEMPLAHEFMMGYEVYTRLDRNPKILSRAGQGVKGRMPSWLVRIVYKPNMTINQSYQWYKESVEYSHLTQKEFSAVAIKKIHEDEPSPLPQLSMRNYVGSVLNSIAMPYFDNYIARLFDLNAKIAIFNQTVNKAELPVDLDYIQNPYYETGGTAYYSEDGKSICLTGPLEDDKNQRCLRVKF